ncbi:MAG: glutathione peroxidase [Pseudomonadota bacterium]
MPTRRALTAAFALAPLVVPVAASVAASVLTARPARAGATTAHAFRFDGIDGDPVEMAAFAGQPVLVVNTASRCGFTYQYDQLQALYDSYRARGLVVLGVPSGDFNQEYATEAAVKEFCEVNFAIDFPMTAITPVMGRRAHPFFAWIERELGRRRAPRWNFYKYLIAPDGRIAGAWTSGTEPMDTAITGKIEQLLASG